MNNTGSKHISPISLLAIGYALIILISALILALPVSSADHVFSSYLDSLFTATSAVTTTGLIVFDTGSYYNLFGQTVIAALFQVGGLGYMLFIILVYVGFSRRISVQSGLMLQESVKRPLKMDIIYFTKLIILFTLAIEFLGAVFLSFIFSGHYPVGRSVYSGIFHSISAFNTAGFSIYRDSFCGFNNHIPLNITLIIVSTLGSLGFFVLFDVTDMFIKRIKGINNRRLSVHSRLVIICAILLLATGSVLIFVNESWIDGFSLKQKVMSSIFQASSASTTTGFNSIDTGKMSGSNLFLTIVLMFIGAGSGGTAGGIKITTFAVALLSVHAIMRNRNSVNVFKRRIPFETIRNSFVIIMLSVLWTVAAVYFLSVTEKQEFLNLLFEVTSALGTVGLSTGITAGLSSMGKIIIILSMFIGRIGPLGIGISLLNIRKEPDYKYSTTDVFIG
ncbi:MAG: Trk family potassium uptake protein [Spirochaetes bacterium]|nr:Trk family potassium uptake protein [Spirochaetota bacterium]